MERFFLHILSAVVLLFSFGIANADYIDCPTGITGSVDGSVDCEISDATQGAIQNDPKTVNTDGGFFGIDSWQFLDMDIEADGPLGTRSVWEFSGDFWSLYDNVMLVFASGEPTTLVGHLLDGEATFGVWDSPFVAPVFNVPGVVEVSQVSYYGAVTATEPGPDPGTPVPEPQTLLLFGLGLIGLVYSRKRKTL
jgi:hypothetical protein